MLDTVVLTLNENDFKINDYDLFSPSARGLFKSPFYWLNKKGYLQCRFRNKGKSKNNIYLPKLTLTKRIDKGGYSIKLRIEFSAPKLLFNNNFDELEESDFSLVVKVLCSRLNLLEICVDNDSVASAFVSSIHYSKNIALPDYVSCSLILNKLYKLNIMGKLDLSYRDYNNGGKAVRLHSNSYEVIFYDKLSDLEQSKISEKRSIEESTGLDLSQISKVLKGSKVNFLRIEVRLNSPKVIRRFIEKVDKNYALRFETLFSESISKQILLFFWLQIISNINWLEMAQLSPSTIFEICKRKKFQDDTALKLIGFLYLNNEMGHRSVKNLIGSKTYNLNKKIKKVEEELEYITIDPNFLHIQSSLEKFSPNKLKNFNTNIRI